MQQLQNENVYIWPSCLVLILESSIFFFQFLEEENCSVIIVILKALDAANGLAFGMNLDDHCSFQLKWSIFLNLKHFHA